MVSLTVTSITLTEAFMDQVPKLFCGAVGSGVGSVKLAEHTPDWFVIPCLTNMTEPFEFCIEKITFSSGNEALLHVTDAYISTSWRGPYDPAFAPAPMPLSAVNTVMLTFCELEMTLIKALVLPVLT